MNRRRVYADDLITAADYLSRGDAIPVSFIERLSEIADYLLKPKAKKARPRKETSPEISALAGRYLAMDADDIRALANRGPLSPGQRYGIDVLAADIKRLAASALGQDETKGQKP